MNRFFPLTLLVSFICFPVFSEHDSPSLKSEASPTEKGLSDYQAKRLVEGARDYFKANDWEQFVPAAQKILDGKEVFFKDGDKRINLRAEVEKMVEALPKAGREFYALSFDAESKNLLKESERKGDNALLEEIFWRFGNTEAGMKAGKRLAGFHGDRQHPYTATFFFQELLKLKDLPAKDRQEILVMQLLCYASMGEMAKAESTSEALRGELKGGQLVLQRMVLPDELEKEIRKYERPADMITRGDMEALLDEKGPFERSEAYRQYRKPIFETTEALFKKQFGELVTKEVFEEGDPPKLKDSPTSKGVWEIVRHVGKGEDVEGATKGWLADGKVDSKVKGDLLALSLGSGRYHALLDGIPQAQRSEVEAATQKRFNFGLFEERAKEKSISPALLGKANLRSFEFVSFKFPPQGNKVTLASKKRANLWELQRWI